jgi:glycosyltransferase involved in cell wall biosynthesis
VKIVLATGIYPPDIGGPATYVAKLAAELVRLSHDVTVIAYGTPLADDGASLYRIIRVPKTGGPLGRWRRYATVLREVGRHADVVEAFSAVSVGVPLLFSRLRGPVTVLRLGGDFPWERATDRGYQHSLRAWLTARAPSARVLSAVLYRFDHIVFSTEFQRRLYRSTYAHLPPSSVIENALSVETESPVLHQAHSPFRLLSFGRFVPFKNLPALIRAMHFLPGCTLTLVGEGPAEADIRRVLESHPEFGKRVRVFGPVHGLAKRELFRDHDLLVVPSLTEISPNSALEARASGLPVLLTRETGLSDRLTDGMVLAHLRTPEAIALAVETMISRYSLLAPQAAAPLHPRSWHAVAEEHLSLFTRLR